MKQQKTILFTNCMGMEKGRQYRIVDPSNLTTIAIIITDDNGEGSARARPELARHRWVHLSECTQRTVETYKATMRKKILRSQTSDEAKYDLNERIDGFKTTEYPVTQMGSDLERNAVVTDIRRCKTPGEGYTAP